jgi:hypothetical protein
MTTPWSNSAGAPTNRLPSQDPAPDTEQLAVPYPESAEPPPIFIRRARSSAFIPPEPREHGQMISRDNGLRRVDKPELTRNRRIAGNLPAWDPMPPGEVRVVPRRPAHRQQ